MNFLDRHGYLLIALFLVIVAAINWPAWTAAQQLSANVSATFTGRGWDVSPRMAPMVAYTNSDYTRITITSEAREVCVEMPEDRLRSWCLPITDLQAILRERYKVK